MAQDGGGSRTEPPDVSYGVNDMGVHRLFGTKMFLVVPWIFLLLIGCSSTPEALRVSSDYPGTFWRVVSVEGPCQVAGKWEERIGEKDVSRHLESNVWFVDLQLQGWGTVLPWCWFARDRACQYSVEWTMQSLNGEQSRGETAVHFWEPVSGALSNPRVVARQLIGGVGDDRSSSLPSCDGRQAVLAQDLLTSRALTGVY